MLGDQIAKRATSSSNFPYTTEHMPPFGKHRIVSEKELDAIVDYLYTL
jgi:mono/diheme cytochrome c family protein